MNAQLNQTPKLDLTESQKLYLPVAELTAEKEAARAAWSKAYEAWKLEPTAMHLAALEYASNQFQAINKKYIDVSMTVKHNRGTVSEEGSDNTMRGARLDAGFDECGPLGVVWKYDDDLPF